MEQMEIRSFATPPTLSEDGRTIEGYAIVYDVESRVLWDGSRDFVEIIDRDAVTEELLRTSDVKALYNHDANKMLARNVNGEGTLSLISDEHGLRFRFEAPHTVHGDEVVELVRRGDLRGCSFAFYADDADVQNSVRADGTPLRRVMRLARLCDVSVVADPAYMQTSVDVRSLAGTATPTPEKHRSIASANRYINLIFY